ncbi:MAG: hypothetical protein IJ797_07690, partial [Selenomonadaceae bacterium]|nr:hypothetical protein [Selenomonadaceae bacterium]
QGFKDMYNAAYAKYNGDNIAFLKNECGIDLTNADTGSVTGWDAGNRVVKDKYNVVSQASRPMNWSLPSSSMTMINGLEISWPKGYNASPTAGTMVFHTGTGANQAMKVSFFDMSARSIGLIDEEGKKLNVSTIGNANQAIGQLDKIINVVLDEATNIGAIQQRLGFTEANVTSSTENTQGAESTIRDADMAKEMTEYGKSNVLSQAAQSMLSKANQAMSSVLSMVTQNGNDTVEESQDTSEAERNSDENLSEVGKDLQKVASGQKINSAADDASAYGISEQMRVQIRGLDQADENVKKGVNILNIAEQAVDQQIDIVKKMREIAMKSSDAACSQADRDVLQSEMIQLRDQLDDIAHTTTYNGITLLDGKVKLVDKVDILYDPTKGVTENEDELIESPYSYGKYLYKFQRTFENFRPNDYSNYTLDFEERVNSVEDLNGQGISLLCTACDQFVSIKFDASLKLNDSRYFSENGIEAFIVGIDGAEDFSDAYESLFQAAKNAGKNNRYSYWNETESSTYLARTGHTIGFEKLSDGSYNINRYNGDSFSGLILFNGFIGTTSIGITYLVRDQKELQIQGSTKDSMYTNIMIPNTTMNFVMPYLEEDCVRTWNKAKESLRDIDGALDYLLDASTTIGAQARRLEYTDDNIITSNENTQAAESTIRDADMAKEYTKYTKDSVLAQASQSMLAQANQNPKFVMSVI